MFIAHGRRTCGDVRSTGISSYAIVSRFLQQVGAWPLGAVEVSMLKRAMSTIPAVLSVLALSPSSFVGFGRDVRLLAAVEAQQTPSQTPSPDSSQGAQANMANMMKMHEQMMA